MSQRIAKERYFSPDFLRLEWEKMWTRVWLLGPHCRDLQNPGDFVTHELGAESTLFVRQQDGRVSAFYNVCQHRGNRLCVENTGCAKVFRCGYHHWEWHTNGAFKRAFRPEGFADFQRRTDLDLAPIFCEEKAGFVWYTLSEKPPSLSDYLGEIGPLMEPYQAGEFHRVAHTTCEIPCNWKLSADVSNEGYHVATLHPELLQILDEKASTLEIMGSHSHITVPVGIPTSDAAKALPPSTALRETMRYMGLDPNTFVGSAGEVRAALQKAVFENARRDGIDLSGLSAQSLVDKHQFYVFPNVQLNFFPRRLEVYRHRPHAADPKVTFFDEEAFERFGSKPVPAKPKHVRFKAGEQSMGPVMGADVALLPSLQKGTESRGFRGLLLSSEEGAIANMHRVLDDYLRGE
ncbi:MAG: Rieske 2Fe-2S domain-containing protein [Polyangiaceae bacterium]|nr:Rieske 2Fe-2S domain-containing protein [Polyangiaceae bacterium]